MMSSNAATQNGVEKLNPVLTKKDIRSTFLRWFMCAQICFNYETMQSGAVVYALGPALEKITKNQPEQLKEKLKTHFQFFNTQPWMGGLIIASALAIEESDTENATETAGAIKTSLMGPFAGLGDSIFFVLPKTIFGAIAAYMALEGSSLGIGICVLIGLAMLFVRYKMFEIGYTQGVKFITEKQKVLSILTEAASVMGLVVVGALIASNVRLSIPIEFNVGETTSSVQATIDTIMPNLLPLGVTLGTYWALGRKKMTSTKMVWLIIVLSVIAYAFGIVA